MTSFMSKKKKYKFQVEICLEDLLAVPFVSAVLFAKLRLLDGGSFQDHSSRQEVKDHKVHWDAKFSFPCKMMANASTGVMEKCILRISIRKECKGGRSFTKLGFVDLNLAEYAGAGVIHKNALLEGYDTRHRQDNSMLKFSIQLNMMSGDILFKAPSPSLKHKQIPSADDPLTDQRSDEFSSGSLAGSINSGSSGFGSLPKKRSQLMSSDLIIGQTLTESAGSTSTNAATAASAAAAAATISIDPIGGYGGIDSTTLQPVYSDLSLDNTIINQHSCQELQGHSRNSSNTSQMSRGSGYSSVSHSRQSSSGDSAAGHIRNQLQHNSLKRPSPSSTSSTLLLRAYTYPKHRLNIPTTILSESPNGTLLNQSNFSPEVFHTPQGSMNSPNYECNNNNQSTSLDEVYSTPQEDFATPRKYITTNDKRNLITRQNTSSEDSEIYKTPVSSFCVETVDVFSKNFNELQKSASSGVIENYRSFFPGKNQLTNNNVSELVDLRQKTNDNFEKNTKSDQYFCNRNNNGTDGVLRSKSEFIIPKLSSPDPRRRDRSITNMIASFLTPRLQRKQIGTHSTPFKHNNTHLIITNNLTNQESRAVSMGSLKLNNNDNQHFLLAPGSIERMHRKILLDGSPLPKLATMISCSPPENEAIDSIIEYMPSPPSDMMLQRRPSTIVMLNPSSCSLATSTSESGSLERAKAAYERRKKNTNMLLDEGGGGGSASGGSSSSGVPGRVEITRVNPEDFIAELLKSTNLEQPDDSAETSGLQLFIAKDGTAALGNHEVKSQMSTGVNTFKQVVMDDR